MMGIPIQVLFSSIQQLLAVTLIFFQNHCQLFNHLKSIISIFGSCTPSYVRAQILNNLVADVSEKFWADGSGIVVRGLSSATDEKETDFGVENSFSSHEMVLSPVRSINFLLIFFNLEFLIKKKYIFSFVCK